MSLTHSSFNCLPFCQINSEDLYQMLKLRSEVFVLEQQCAYLDLDGLDQQAHHVFRKSSGNQIMSYARILPPVLPNNQYSSIGRVVVAPSHRHKNLGRDLMLAAVAFTENLFPNHPIQISAQTYLTQFYQSLGFVNTGHFYLEDDIPHQEMRYKAT